MTPTDAELRDLAHALRLLALRINAIALTIEEEQRQRAYVALGPPLPSAGG